MTRHSPGPWRRGIGNECHTVFDAQGSVVADRTGTTDGMLIAAAVEMLEACRHLSAFHDQVFCGGRPLSIDGKVIDHTTINKACDAAKRAFAKMDGFVSAAISQEKRGNGK